MRARGHSAGPSITPAVGLAVLALMMWQWQARVMRDRPLRLSGDASDVLTAEHPVRELTASALSGEQVQAVVDANPFAAQRRLGARQAQELSDQGHPDATSFQPRFLYKGRVEFGQQPRAILEETTTNKTYFLEVGQEVAGFKLLDNSSNQVVLLDLKTREQITVTRKASYRLQDR